MNPDYLEEPSEEEAKFFESRQGEDGKETEPPEGKPEAEEKDAPEAEKEAVAEKPEEKPGTDVEEPKVNLGALHEARAQTKELRSELGQARERMASMETRFDQILEEIKKPAPSEPAPDSGPSHDEDPDGYYRHRIEAQDRKIEELQETGKKTREQDDQTSEQQKFLGKYRAAAEEYGKAQEDFMPAYEWLAKSIDAELQARGFRDPLERQRIIDQEEARMVAMAFDSNVNPAERLYELAKHRGYRLEKKPEVDRIENLDKATSKAKSLSGTGGGTENPGTLEHLASLNGKDFDAAWEKMRRSGKLG